MTEIESEITSWGLQYFAHSEILFLGASHYGAGRAHGKNYLPTMELLQKLKPAALAADEARRRLGSPLKVLSGYRSPEYNRAISGASRSYHVRCMALDLHPMRDSVSNLYQLLRRMRNEGWAGCQGIGKYSWGCHIDSGPTRTW